MSRQQTFDVVGAARLDVETKSGAVEVRAGAPGRVEVQLDGDDEGWVVEQMGDTIAVRPPPSWSWRSRSVRVRVLAPANSDVEVRAASADVGLLGRHGVVRIRTVSGDVRVDAVGKLDVSTASGDVRVGAVDVDLGCSTASGDVEVGDVMGRLTASTASGGVHASRLAGDAQIGTASGDVRIDRYEGSDLAIKCVSGDIVVGLPAGIRVEPDISTLSGRTRLPVPRPPTGAPPAPRRVVRVWLRTVSGNVTIDRVG